MASEPDPKAVHQAIGPHWAQVLVGLGVPEKAVNGKNQPCPLCGGTDRFRYTNHNGQGLSFCNQCGGRDGIKLLRDYHGWSLKEALSYSLQFIRGTTMDDLPKPKPDPTPAEKWERCRNILKGCIAVSPGDPVHAYLSGRKVIDAPRKDIGYHASLGYRHHGSHPAMVSVARNGNGKPTGLHVTYLSDTGTKADVPKPKLMYGTLKGAAVKIRPEMSADNILVLAEGIETAMAVAVHAQPNEAVWACLSTPGMVSVEIPDDVDLVMIYADLDTPENPAGLVAAATLYQRLCRGGTKASLHLPPPVPGRDKTDWLDYYTSF